MSKPIEFTADEVALCPNGCGPMLMVTDADVERNRFLVREARAFCRRCRHTMMVADERGPECSNDSGIAFSLVGSN